MMFDPVKFRRRVWNSLMWVLPVLVAAVPRVVMLFTVERRLDADASIVGLMSKHIAHGEGVPFFFYGQSYGGGHVIEALFSAPLLLAFGMKPWALHVVPAVFGVASVLLVFWMVRRMYDVKAAFWGAILFALSIPYLKLSLKVNGYTETIFLGLAGLAFLLKMEEAVLLKQGRRGYAFAALSGAALGLAFWSFDFAVAYAVAVFIMGLRRGLLHAGRMLTFMAGYAVGALPLIAANLLDNFSHLRHMVGGGPPQAAAAAKAGIVSKVIALFSSEIPAFLTPDCGHNFVYPVPWYAWFGYAAILVSVGVLLTKRKRIPTIFVVVPGIMLAAYLASGYSGRSPRYFMPLEPYMALSIALALWFMKKSRRHISRLAWIVIMVLTAAWMAGGIPAIFADDSVVEGNVKTHPDSIPAAVSILEKENINCIETTYFVKWQVLFMTDERINAVDITADKRPDAYLRYEKRGCPPGVPPSYVFHKQSPYWYVTAARINRSGDKYRIYHTEDHVVVIPVDRTVAPEKPEEGVPAEEELPDTDAGAGDAFTD